MPTRYAVWKKFASALRDQAREEVLTQSELAVHKDMRTGGCGATGAGLLGQSSHSALDIQLSVIRV